MTKNFLIAAASGLLWTNFVAPAILRTFGVPVAFGMWRVHRRNQNLSRTQYAWGLGVFMWGLGMFLFFVIFSHLEWRQLGVKNPMRIFGMLLSWLVLGWLVGILGARHRQEADSSRR